MKILVIDDSDMMRRFLSEALASAGHDVVVASNGREGVAAFERTHVDLVITDLYMPDRDGIEVLLDVKRLEPALPIIVMSAGGAYVRSDELAAAQLLGATVVLRKPFGLTQLRTAIDDVRRVAEACPARDA